MYFISSNSVTKKKLGYLTIMILRKINLFDLMVSVTFIYALINK